MKPTILFVDDDPLALKMFQVTFKKFYTIKACNSPQDALKALEKDRFNMIITDYKMPKVDGLALLDIVTKKYPSTRKIILTASLNFEKTPSAAKYTHVSKPWNKVTLKDRIDEVLAS